MIQGRAISQGIGKGVVVKLDESFSFLGGANPTTGDLRVAEGKNIAGKVFVFPKGKGSTVGSFVMYDLMVHGKAPVAIINRDAETIVTTGAVISSIPMVDGIDTDILRDGDMVEVNGNDGTISIEGVGCRKAVFCAIIRKDGKVLTLKRADNCTYCPGKRSLVTGKVEPGEDTVSAARREIMEETGISVGDVDLEGRSYLSRNGNDIWELIPYRFMCSDEEPVLNHENSEYRWMTLDEIEMCQDLIKEDLRIIRDLL